MCQDSFYFFYFLFFLWLCGIYSIGNGNKELYFFLIETREAELVGVFS